MVSRLRHVEDPFPDGLLNGRHKYQANAKEGNAWGASTCIAWAMNTSKTLLSALLTTLRTPEHGEWFRLTDTRNYAAQQGFPHGYSGRSLHDTDHATYVMLAMCGSTRSDALHQMMYHGQYRAVSCKQ